MLGTWGLIWDSVLAERMANLRLLLYTGHVYRPVADR